MKYDLITILGPTASGKTTLAAALADKLQTEIISGDSRQVYRRMDLGTGKDLDDYTVNGRSVPYHLIDIVEPGTPLPTVKNYKPAKPSLFKKDTETNPLLTYLEEVQHSCFVCNKINNVFDRYIATIFFLYEKESDFRNTVDNCKGFCSEHYALLLKEAPKQLSGKYVEDFTNALHKSYIKGMERVRDDLSWFIDKFDYRYKDEPWKNSKDALPRMLQKVNSSDIKE